MKTFHVRVIASDKIFYDGDCTYLVVPEPDGQKAFMAGHETVAIAIVIGELYITKPDGEKINGAHAADRHCADNRNNRPL